MEARKRTQSVSAQSDGGQSDGVQSGGGQPGGQSGGGQSGGGQPGGTQATPTSLGSPAGIDPEVDGPGVVRQRLERRALANRNGVILRSEATEAGLTRANVDWSIRSGRWVSSPAPGALLVKEKAQCPVARLTAATLGLGGVAWGLSALALWGLVEFPHRPVVASSAQSRCKGITVSRPRNLAGLKKSLKNGVPTVSLEVSVAAAARSLSLAELQSLIDEALRRRLTTWPRIEEALEASCQQGRPGTRIIRAVLLSRRDDDAVPLSDWSREFADKLVVSGLPRPKMEWRVLRPDGELLAQVDLAYPSRKYIIELDSVAYHLNREAFEMDRRRDSQLLQVGWTVSRFTWKQSMDWDSVIATIQAGLGRTGLGRGDS